MPETNPIPARCEYEHADGLCHIAADDAGTVALCGTDVATQPWCDCDGECRKRLACVVCESLDVEDITDA